MLNYLNTNVYNYSDIHVSIAIQFLRMKMNGYIVEHLKIYVVIEFKYWHKCCSELEGFER